jgi:hypothetical protein
VSDTKFTQGPWRIGTPPPNGEQTIGTTQGLMVAVATTGGDTPTLSNARLIAAAPALFSALQAAAEYLDGIPESAVGGDDDAVRIARNAFAALAKARGEA